MSFNVPSYEDRVAKIKTVKDIDKQLNLATAYSKRLRTAAKKAEMLAEKLALNEQHKIAERVVRQLRHGIWDIEDRILAEQAASAA
jgi:ribosome-binding protein aMBF1 (putative translation factor)